MAVSGLRIVHLIPGRVRLKFDHVKGNPELAHEIEERLRSLTKIYQVEANPLTGSVLILYDPTLLDNGILPLVSALGELGLLPQNLNPALVSQDGGDAEVATTAGADTTTALCNYITTVLGTADQNVRSFTKGAADLRALVPATLFVLGIGTLLTGPVTAPAWYEYLWFSFATYTSLNASVCHQA